MEKIYKYNTTVESDRVDFNFNMTIPSMIAHFQTLATYHSLDLGCDYFTMKDKDNAFWVVTKVKLGINRYPRFNDKIELCTWYEKPSMLRCPRKKISQETCLATLKLHSSSTMP